MNRRDFLKALIAGGAAAAAVLASDAALAHALPSRYQRLIRVQKHAIAVKNKVYENSETWHERGAKLTPAMADVFKVLHEDFHGGDDLENNKDAMFEGIKKIFTREGMIDTMSESELRRYENPIIAVATARYLLAYEKLTFDPQKVPHWDSFVKLYQDAIIRA